MRLARLSHARYNFPRLPCRRAGTCSAPPHCASKLQPPCSHATRAGRACGQKPGRASRRFMPREARQPKGRENHSNRHHGNNNRTTTHTLRLERGAATPRAQPPRAASNRRHCMSTSPLSSARADAQNAAASTRTSHVIFASFIGTAIEFYDFYVYATAAALVIGPVFFPHGSATAQALSAFVTFGIASSRGRSGRSCSATSATASAASRRSSRPCSSWGSPPH